MLRIGVFGVGHLGKFHLNNWKDIDGAEVVGFYDPDDTTAIEVAEKYQLRRFPDPDSLLNQCDAIDVVAPTNYHFELCEKAIKKGKHIFVEKPLANTMEEARQLVKLAEESGIKFQVGHVERFNPAFLAIKDMPLHPMFIEVHRLAQFNPRGTEVSVILDLMIHDIDIILSIVKSDVKSIAIPGTNEFPLFSQRINSRNPSAGCLPVIGMTPWILDQRKQIVFLPNRWKPVSIHLGNIGMIACYHIK